MTTSREMLRHTLATLAYRCGKAVKNAPPEFAEFHVSEVSRTPGQILAHIGDLLDWSLGLCEGRHEWHDSEPLPWEQEVERFFAGMEKFDARLSDPRPLGFPEEKIFQGPIADALTHTGQIAMLRRIAGAPMKGENYFKAEIAAGRVGAEQAAPKYEFD